MKLKITFLYLLSFSLFLGSAKAQQDSLLVVWEDSAEEDTNRLKALHRYYMKNFMYVDMDSAFYYARTEYRYADEKGLDLYRAIGLNSLGQCFLVVGAPDSAIYYFDRAKVLFRTSGDLVGAAGAIINKGIILANLGLPDSAVAQYREGIALCDEIGEVPFKLNALNNIATIRLNQGRFEEAILGFEEVLELCQPIEPKPSIYVGSLLNLGFTLARKGDHGKAISLYHRALKAVDEERSSQFLMAGYNFLGTSYAELGETDNALKYLNLSYEAAEAVGEKSTMATALSMVGKIYENQGSLEQARSVYQRAYKLLEKGQHISVMVQPLIDLGLLDVKQALYDSAIIRLDSALVWAKAIAEEDKEAAVVLGLGQAYFGLGQYEQASSRLLEANQMAAELGDKALLYASAKSLSDYFEKQGDAQRALEFHKQYLLYRDSVNSDENRRTAISREYLYTYEKQALADSLEFARKESLKNLELEKQSAKLAQQRLGLAAVISLALLLIMLAYFIRKGKQRSDDLLHNILPEPVATELKAKGYSEAQRFDEAHILFTDFKDFTQLSEGMNPEDLVAEIDCCFKAFDLIMEDYGVEKIKTIGDAYMAVGGLQASGVEQASKVVSAALRMQEFMLNRKASRLAEGLPFFEMRVGIHSGPVVAGIVGLKKFQYDIWGDSVNTASRIESAGQVGRVNISKRTHEIIAHVSGLKFQSRGLIEIKGKEPQEMWFVEEAD